MKKIIGTCVTSIYTDDEKNRSGVIVVSVPGTKMYCSRPVVGDSLRERSLAAGREIARLTANFIENNPIISKETAEMFETDGVCSYPQKSIESDLIEDFPADVSLKTE